MSNGVITLGTILLIIWVASFFTVFLPLSKKMKENGNKTHSQMVLAMSGVLFLAMSLIFFVASAA
jgi:hypothetical protein